MGSKLTNSGFSGKFSFGPNWAKMGPKMGPKNGTEIDIFVLISNLAD